MKHSLIILPILLLASLNINAVDQILPLTESEKSLLYLYTKANYEDLKTVDLSGKRLHEIINNPDLFGASDIAGAIMAHEGHNHISKEEHKCWDTSYITAIISHRKFYSIENSGNIANSLRIFLTFPNAKNEALAIISQYDYPKFTDDNMRGKFFLIAGYCKLQNKAYQIDDAIRDFNAAAIAFNLSHNDERYLCSKMEEIKAKMTHSVYVKYTADLDNDFFDASNVLSKVNKDDSLIGSFHHTRGLHLCNQGMITNNVELVKNAQADFKIAREHKLRNIKTANGYAATCKINGDIALRLAIKFNHNPTENLTVAKNMYLETFQLNPDFGFDEYKELLYSFYLSLDKTNSTAEFLPLLIDYNEKDELNPNFKAAIQFTLAVIKGKD